MIPLKNEKHRALIERREELKEKINKLMREYKAIGDIMEENIKLQEENKKLKESREDEYEK